MGTGVGLLFNQLSPKAFAAIGWRYYAVFVGCDAVAAFCFFVFYPETRGKTLEEMAELFGDRVAFSEYIGGGQRIEHSPDSKPEAFGQSEHLNYQAEKGVE